MLLILNIFDVQIALIYDSKVLHNTEVIRFSMA